jgi:type I restriction enzyme S subunit
MIVRPLRAFAEVSLGRQRSPDNEDGPNMVPYLRAANVLDGRLDLFDVKSMHFTPKEQSVFSLRDGDVLVTEGAGSLASVGASAVWHGDASEPVCFQNTLLRLRPHKGTDARYLAWWCRHAFADGLFASIAGGANIFHLSADRVRSLPMSSLPMATQHAIADYLDRESGLIDDLLASQHRLVGLLDERIDALIKERIAASALVGKTSTPAIPLKRMLRKVARTFADGAPIVTAYRDGEVNTRSSRRAEGYTLASTEATYQGVHRGDVVIHGLDAFAGAIGQSRADGCCSPVYQVCEPIADNDGRYVARLLRVLAIDGYLGLHATSVRERAVDLRNWGLVGAILVPAVPPEEQLVVGDMIDRAVPVAKHAATMASLLQERRHALITAAVTGQCAVAEAA